MRDFTHGNYMVEFINYGEYQVFYWEIVHPIYMKIVPVIIY